MTFITNYLTELNQAWGVKDFKRFPKRNSDFGNQISIEAESYAATVTQYLRSTHFFHQNFISQSFLRRITSLGGIHSQ